MFTVLAEIAAGILGVCAAVVGVLYAVTQITNAVKSMREKEKL